MKKFSEWFNQSDYDFKTAEALFDTRRYIYSAFMCHLCIEKALKGLYTKELNEIPPKIHNLLYLIKKIDIVFPAELKEFITELNRVSIPTRYPEKLSTLLKDFNRKKVALILRNTAETLKCIKNNSKI